MEPFIVIGNSLDIDQVSLNFANTAELLVDGLGFLHILGLPEN